MSIFLTTKSSRIIFLFDSHFTYLFLEFNVTADTYQVINEYLMDEGMNLLRICQVSAIGSLRHKQFK